MKKRKERREEAAMTNSIKKGRIAYEKNMGFYSPVDMLQLTLNEHIILERMYKSGVVFVDSGGIVRLA